ncbi:cupin domain-containing protein [Mesobaculum littorinae]|uniref:Cupin domain-containing protein n=2 Tax=Mesobaculum littorinae TaxID=2486419 RepID=A0A438AJU2_9RHOB|nr:cupin domain-containing protein [Mesobaculum littorinae]
MEGREKRALGDVFGLGSFGVNLTRLRPGAVSALLHSHSVQDEFIYVLEGTPTLRQETETGILSTELQAGMCAGFAARGAAHQLVNHGAVDAVYLEIGDRAPGDEVGYPEDDLKAVLIDGAWRFAHRDGTPY